MQCIQSIALYIIILLKGYAPFCAALPPEYKIYPTKPLCHTARHIPPSNASSALQRGFWVDWVGFLSMLFGLGGVRGFFKSDAKHQFLRLWSSLWNISLWTLKASKSRSSWWEFWSLAAKSIRPTGPLGPQLATVSPASKCGRRGRHWKNLRTGLSSNGFLVIQEEKENRQNRTYSWKKQIAQYHC